MLSAAQIERFHRDGYLVLEGFKSAADCDRLIERAEALVEGFDPETVRSIFSTTNQTQATDAYFLESGDKIRFFFEEEAFDAAGRLRQPKHLSINKIGHALHDLDPVFDAFSRDPRLAEIAREVGPSRPLLLQSMYIFKQPRIGGEVVCHQDSSFLFTEPLSVVGFWFALQDATLENGCMQAIPGGRATPLRRRFRRDGPASVTMEELDSKPWPEERRVALEVPKGTLILLHGQLPHLSGPNRSERSRHAYTLHAIDGAAHYPADNWLQRGPDMPLRGFDGTPSPSSG